ncbi:sensor histidine kinase [Inquilinus limosus]|uniref:sensor histidine kinase n=1 Tax=Inquilinus limosus TaxID=171674 RepID=UPI0009DC2140|nr:sensor histidine kinase [Inquilinus limosus]
MRRLVLRWGHLAPYVGLTVAVLLSSWAFLQSERYREKTNIILSQTLEIQWRASQIRERIANLIGLLRLAQETGQRDPRLLSEFNLLDFNITALRDLEYVERFLEPEDLTRLAVSKETIESRIYPVLANQELDPGILQLVYDIQASMGYISGTAVSHSRTLNETAYIEEEAQRNLFFFMISATALAVVGVIIFRERLYIRRYDQYLRSFSSLFAHMTRSRVAALGLFVKSLSPSAPPSKDFIAAAKRATEELDSINEGLLRIAYSDQPKAFDTLRLILDALAHDHQNRIRFDVPDNALRAAVASPHFHMILDELVRNAEQAIEEAQRPDPSVTIRARLSRRFPTGARQLIVEVIDNGIGMSPAVRQKVLEPFFSTRAGTHVGLGLTGCYGMLKSLGGSLRISSEQGVGTSVRIAYPLKRRTEGAA